MFREKRPDFGGTWRDAAGSHNYLKSEVKRIYKHTMDKAFRGEQDESDNGDRYGPEEDIDQELNHTFPAIFTRKPKKVKRKNAKQSNNVPPNQILPAAPRSEPTELTSDGQTFSGVESELPSYLPIAVTTFSDQPLPSSTVSTNATDETPPARDSAAMSNGRARDDEDAFDIANIAVPTAYGLIENNCVTTAQQEVTDGSTLATSDARMEQCSEARMWRSLQLICYQLLPVFAPLPLLGGTLRL